MQRVRLLRTAALALCATALFVQSAAAFTAPLSLVSPHPARLRRGLGRRDRPPRPTMAAPTDLEGVYDFAHPGGTFDVHLRPGGRFFAPLFQARASWSLAEDQRLLIDFQKYGRYELTRLEGSAEFEGSAVGDPSNWRKMKRRRPFSEAEAKLLDSVWELQHPGMPCERVRALPDPCLLLEGVLLSQARDECSLRRRLVSSGIPRRWIQPLCVQRFPGEVKRDCHQEILA